MALALEFLLSMWSPQGIAGFGLGMIVSGLLIWIWG